MIFSDQLIRSLAVQPNMVLKVIGIKGYIKIKKQAINSKQAKKRLIYCKKKNNG